MNRSLFAAMFLAPALGIAAPLLDPAAGKVQLTVNQADQRVQSVENAQSPDGSAMLHARWDANVANYLEFFFQKLAVIPEFESGKVKMELFWPENSNITKVNLRLTDATGEVHQYPLPIKDLKPGRQIVEYDLKPASPGSWGGNKDGKIDFPAKFTGISIDFQSGTGPGELWIGAVDFTADPLKPGELIADAATAPAVVHKGSEQRQSAIPGELGGKAALHVKWDAAAAKWIELNFQPQLPVIAEFPSARFDIELWLPENFEKYRPTLRLADATGETFQYPLPMTGLKPGWNLVSLRIKGDGKQNVGSWSGNKDGKIDFPVRVSGFSVDYPSGSGAGELGIGTIGIAR